MLYEFHQQQNAKKPATVHATYLVSGTKPKEISPTDEQQKDGEDEYMQSSPFMSSSMPQQSDETGETSVLSISLVREEDLESTKASSCHINTIAHVNHRSEVPIREHQLNTYLQPWTPPVEGKFFSNSQFPISGNIAYTN